MTATHDSGQTPPVDRTDTAGRTVEPVPAVFVDPSGLRLRRWRSFAGTSSLLLVMMLILVLAVALIAAHAPLPEPRWAR